MLWVVFALATAWCVATGDALTKKFFGRYSPLDMAVACSLYSLPFLFLAYPFISVPELSAGFWWLAGIVIPLDTIAFYLHMKAIKLSPLSLCMPFLAFTPVFMLATGFVVLQEIPNGWGLVGVLFVVCGSYILHAGKVKQGCVAPFRAIFKEPGSVLMLTVAILYSLLAVLGKKAIQLSSPMFFGFFFLAGLDIVTLLVFPFLGNIRWKALIKRRAQGLSVGAMLSLHILFHAIGIAMVKAIYMIAVKRSSILFSVLYGWLLFRESDIRNRMLGALLMFVGVACITLLG